MLPKAPYSFDVNSNNRVRSKHPTTLTNQLDTSESNKHKLCIGIVLAGKLEYYEMIYPQNKGNWKIKGQGLVGMWDTDAVKTEIIESFFFF